MRRTQRGVTIPMLALCMVILLAMAALAIDLGILFTARTSAQHAADAAALAGAFTFLNAGAAQPGTAQQYALSVAAKNAILTQQVAITAANVNVEVANRRVTVTIPRTGANGIETFFAKAIGWQRVDVQVQATAEAGKNAVGTRCLKPLYIPNTVLSAKGQNACNAPKEVIFNSDGSVSTWAAPKLGTDTAYDVTPANPQAAFKPSQFYALDFGSGGSTYRCSIGNCLNECGIDSIIKCGDKFPLETGALDGPTKQGVDDLIGSPADTWGGKVDGIYTYHPGGAQSISMDTSKSLGIMPVWDNCAEPIDSGKKGQKVTVVGFLEVFVDRMNGKSVEAHFVQPISCATAGGGGPVTGSGPYGYPVRLVNMP